MSGNNAKQAPTYLTLVAGSDLSTKEKYFMALSSGKLAVAGAGASVIGVLDDDPSSDGAAGRVQNGGIAVVLAGGTCTRDLGAASDASGKAVNASGSARVIGTFLDTGSSGDYVRVILGAISTAQASDFETVTAAGALNPAVPVTALDITSTVAYTLAVGTTIGQKKRIEVAAAATSPRGTVTLADAFGTESLTHVFTAVGQVLDLEWRSTGWKVVGKRRAGTQVLVIGTTLTAGLDMAAVYDLQTTATVHSLTTMALPSGMIPGEVVSLICTVAATCPVGDIDFVGVSLVGAAVTHITAITATTDNATLLWNGAAWVPLLNTGLTIN